MSPSTVEVVVASVVVVEAALLAVVVVVVSLRLVVVVVVVVSVVAVVVAISVVVVILALVVVVTVVVVMLMVEVAVEVVVVVVVTVACGHKRKPPFRIDLSEDQVMDFCGTIPSGPLFPLYATPLTMRLSYNASVSNLFTTIGDANESLIAMLQNDFLSYVKG